MDGHKGEIEEHGKSKIRHLILYSFFMVFNLELIDIIFKMGYII